MGALDKVIRHRHRIGVAAVLVATALATSPGPAGAELPQATGYWNRIKPTNPQGLEALGNPIPPPPDVPQESLLVASAPGGEPQSIAALRWAASSPKDATLILQLDDGSDSQAGGSTPPDPDTPILACAATSTWDGEVDGAWVNRAQWDADDCTSSVGNAADMTMSWPIDERHFVDGPVVDTIEVVLVADGSSPTRTIFDKPGPDSLRANDGSALLRSSGFEFGAPAVTPTTAPPTSAPAPVASPTVLDGSVSQPTPTFASPTPSVAAPTPTPAVTTPAPTGTALPQVPIGDDGTDDRLRAMALLSLMGIGLAFASSGGARQPALIGGLARRTA